MRTADWARLLADHPSLQPVFDSAEGHAAWFTVAPEARAFLIAALHHRQPRKTLIVVPTYERALQWQAKLELCGIPGEEIAQLPSGTSTLFEDAAPEHNAISDRLGALRSLAKGGPCIVLATASSALERSLPVDVIQESFIELNVGMELDVEKLVRQLVHLGYEPQEPVRLPGQYSRRGGIVDLFASGHDFPFRIELYGDEIESIRHFDPNTQRSIGSVDSINLSPSRETLYIGGESEIRQLILDAMERETSMLDTAPAERLRELVLGDAEAIAEGVYFDRLDLYRPLLHPDSGCAIDLIGDNDLLVLDEPLELESIAARNTEELAQALTARADRGEILSSTATDFMLPFEHVADERRVVSLSAMNALPDWLKVAQTHEIGAVSLDPYRGRAEVLTQTLKNWKEQGFTKVFTTDQPNRAQAVLSQVEIHPLEGEEALAVWRAASGPDRSETSSRKKKAPINDHEEAPNTQHLTPNAFLAHGNLAGGFTLPHLKLAFISDAELFGVARLRMPQRRFSEGAPVATVLDLKPGDYVVHIHFGIGVFRGLVTREEQSLQKEFLYIEYQAPDKLYVPADQLDRIQKYLNPGDEHPKLNKLTGGEWQRTLGKAKEEAREFARDLVKLYAARKSVQRRAYGPDTPWQAEMEATFPWVETRTQMDAIRDTKLDMQLEWPMDRLVCGDVGFGKTEVAIRAAFKSLQDGRQVAVLCPTTILSEQHYRNFCERLVPFGVRIELANRFKTVSERHKIFENLKKGEVDLIIGTHALLGKDIQFKNLGLVVIDEEQRFGVKQKEMLKQLRTEVDVLTLSATPIPRTLSMALMDIRQMSLITDPPPGRLPIRTFVRPFSREVVREAVLRELARGGQVFYVYNRVQGINHVAEQLRSLVPTARIGVGHGQMNEKELEPIMIGFIKGEIDILLSTTIIESGIDIPNANTLIVENADRLGLAQLYQLRGRVGRSDRQAYAYMLYQSGKELNENALARLQALQEFSTLGSGYSLAFRDLQIRGAGELLGAKQHGAMANVGYELYTQLISEAVHALKTSVDGAELPMVIGEVKDPLEALEPLPAFELPIEARLPEEFIKDQAQRLYYYQKMMAARDTNSLEEVRSAIQDRYGHLPEEAFNAFSVMSLRMKAKELGIEKMDAKQGRISVQFKDRSSVPPRVFTILGRMNREAYVSREAFIWPYHGSPIESAFGMLDAFDAAHREMEEARASLGV